MRDPKYKVITFIRLVIFLFVIVNSLFAKGNFNYEYFIFFLLLYVLNIQIRARFFTGKLQLTSVLLDFALIYYINLNFAGISHLLIFVTLLDSLLLLKKESYIISFIVALFLVYFSMNKSFEIVSLQFFLYFLSIGYIYIIRKLEANLSITTTLYDSNRLYSYELESTKKKLEDYARIVEHASQMEERNRISREIHDTIGHKLTGTLMQLEASLRISNIENEKGKEMLYSVRDNLSNCINILRQTVRNIKPKEYTSRIILIRQMLDEFQKTTGVVVEFNIAGTVPGIYPSIELALYKNIQEAVTNSVRHGNAIKIDIELMYMGNLVILTIKDNGKGCKNIVKGMGLTGMEERVKLLGGKLIVSSEDCFTLKTFIPIYKDIVS